MKPKEALAKTIYESISPFFGNNPEPWESLGPIWKGQFLKTAEAVYTTAWNIRSFAGMREKLIDEIDREMQQGAMPEEIADAILALIEGPADRQAGNIREDLGRTSPDVEEGERDATNSR